MASRVRLGGNLYNPVVPEGAVDITRRSKWGNPHVVFMPRRRPCPCGGTHTVAEAVALFRAGLLSGSLRVSVEDVRRELAGLDLACWCPAGGPCHGDVLLAVANSA